MQSKMMKQNKEEVIKAVKRLTSKIESHVCRPMTIMEVCGTHTHALFAHGIRSMIPKALRLISGPGCPVCVTSQEDVEKMISLAMKPEVTVCTFGDMMRVPGATGSLLLARTNGADVRVMYSPFDVIEWAQKKPDRQFALIGIGFETTTPSFAATLRIAKQRGLSNLFILSLHKSVVQALDPLANIPGLAVDGLILPGHVIAITGVAPFRVLEDKYHLASVVTGFEALDILTSIEALTRMVNDGKPLVLNQYTRVVREKGNRDAQLIMNEVFKPCDSIWRGMGSIPDSGYALRDDFSDFDAETRFDLSVEPTPEPPGCICGQVITGSAEPTECPLFAKNCTPTNPIGPCMVSGEGTCSAYYKYKRH